jgi:glycosyltransferase involved in cell wall biosynthesis
MAHSSPKVSIVTPLYNHRRFLNRTADGVHSQSLKDWEWIVVDDASTDESAQFVEDIRRWDSRIHLAQNEKNQGIVKTTQRGIDSARGEFMMILDSDDWIAPEFLAKTVNAMEGNPGASLVHTRSLWMDENDDTWGGWPAMTSWVRPGLEVFRSEITNYSIRGNTALYRKSLVDPIGGWAALPLARFHDKYYDLRVMLEGDVVFLGEPLGATRTHPGNHSGQMDEQLDPAVAEQTFTMYDDLLSRYVDAGRDSSDKLRAEVNESAAGYISHLICEAENREMDQIADELTELLTSRGLQRTVPQSARFKTRAFRAASPFIKVWTKQPLKQIERAA